MEKFLYDRMEQIIRRGPAITGICFVGTAESDEMSEWLAQRHGTEGKNQQPAEPEIPPRGGTEYRKNHLITEIRDGMGMLVALILR